MKTIIAILLLAACMALADDRKPAAKPAGKWEISTENDPINNTQKILLSLDAHGGGDNAPILYVRKTGDTIEVFIVYPGLPEIKADHADVTTRWDSAKPVTREWGIGLDGRTVFCHFLPEFFDGLMKNRKLTATLQRAGKPPLTSVFDLEGFTEAVKSLGIVELPAEGSRQAPTPPPPETITFPPPQPAGSWTGFGGTGTAQPPQ